MLDRRRSQGMQVAAAPPAMQAALRDIGAKQTAEWLQRGAGNDDDARIQALVDERIAAKQARDFARADAIRQQLADEGKLLEAQRLEQRTNFDLEMLEATGVCNGIENYSRYLTGRAPGVVAVAGVVVTVV